MRGPSEELFVSCGIWGCTGWPLIHQLALLVSSPYILLLFIARNTHTTQQIAASHLEGCHDQAVCDFDMASLIVERRLSASILYERLRRASYSFVLKRLDYFRSFLRTISMSNWSRFKLLGCCESEDFKATRGFITD